jgi:Chaperone of endosialidase
VSTSGPSQQTNSTAQTVTNPWGPTQPLLTKVLDQLGQQNQGVTPGQQAGSQALIQEAGQTPQFGPAATSSVNNLFGSSYANESGLLGSGYANLLNNTGTLANPTNLNPMNTPGFSNALATQTQDIQNNINSVFGASGQAPNPQWAQATARGVLQGTAPTIANQYNANAANLLNANQNQFAAGNQTAIGQAGLTEQSLLDQIQAIAQSQQIPGILAQPGTAQLAAANTGYGIPYANIASLESLVNPIAGLGGTSTGTGASTTTSSQPLINTILGAAGLGLGLAGKFAPSDERLKTDIKPIGILFDGLPVYSYRFKADPARRTQFGLLAQEVEQFLPEAVASDPATGFKGVDYNLAAAHAASAMPA